MSLQLTKVVGLATVQDAGRRGQLHQGIPPGGALVPELLACANSAADNPYGEAAIEAFGAITVVAQGRVQMGATMARPPSFATGRAGR